MSLNFEATLRPMVKDVARQVARRFPPSVLTEDCEQDIWLWAYSNKDSITAKIEDHPETWVQQVATTMRKQAFGFCSKERAAAEGGALEDFQKYSLSEIRALLLDAFDYNDWQSFSSFGDSQPRAKALVNTTGDRLASLVDVKAALEKLKDEQYNTLVWFFKYGYTFDQLAVEYDCSTEAARKRVERSVKAVQKLLGPQVQEEYTGRRSVRSNAAWRAANDHSYQEN